MRPLSNIERKLIEYFAQVLDEQRKARLLDDMENAMVDSEVVQNGIITRFLIKGYQRPSYRGQHVIAEGEMIDQDGMQIGILLFGDENDRLFELELIRWDGKEINNIDALDHKVLRILPS
jgi:hypothetical protein